MRRDDFEKLATALGGLAILGCLPDSPAAAAGLRYGDVLLSVNGVPTPNWVAYVKVMNERKRPMVVRVFRDGVEAEYSLDLPVDPPAPEVPNLLTRILDSKAWPAVTREDDEEDEAARKREALKSLPQ
ncbi:MAG: PDZ domain-containing protein [Myxococcaceae bacterium]